jgi:tight adherence protein C
MTTGLLWCSGGAMLVVVTSVWALKAGHGRTVPDALAASRQPIHWSSAYLMRLGAALGTLVPMPASTRFHRHLDQRLSRAGLRDICSPRDWWGCLTFTALVAAGVASLIVVVWGGSASTIVAAALVVPALMHSRLARQAERRASRIAKELPAGIDVLVLCLESGASLGAAMRIACEKQGTGPVQELWGEVLMHIRSGLPRATALRRVMERLDLAPVTSLFTALIQAELRGMSLGVALRAQSAQCLADRFVRAERAALQAPVKLLFPLLTCIFPCTFIVIAVPIAARFVGVGGP